MTRPSDWYLVDLNADPTPGDAFGIRELAKRYSDIAYVAANAASVVRGMRNSSSSEGWAGEAGDVFRSKSDRMPGELSRADDSYSMVAEALTAWADAVDNAQAQADRGLAQARDAQTDLIAAQSSYSEAQRSWSVSHAQQLTQQKLVKQYHDVPPPAGVDLPTDAQRRATTRNVEQATSSMEAAASRIASAQARLDAAKRLVAEAAAARDAAEATTVRRISDAKNSAVKPSSIWEAIQDSAAWQAIVVIATVVLTIVSIVAIFVGGPLVWALIIAATAALMINALLSIAQGKNAWGELALLAVGLIPGGRLLALGATAAHAAIAAIAVTRIGERLAPTALRLGEDGARVTRALDGGDVLTRHPTRIDVAFDYKPHFSRPEWDRQITNAQDELDNTTFAQWLERRDNFTGTRSAEVRNEQASIRKVALADKIDSLMDEGYSYQDADRMAADWMGSQHAIHTLDAVAGGDPLKFDGVGDGAVNSAIGSQWRARVPELESQIRDIARLMTPEQLRTTLLNVRLTG